MTTKKKRESMGYNIKINEERKMIEQMKTFVNII